MADELCTIGEAARRAGVGVETLRYYEREGLIPEPPRTPAGYRLYGAQDIRRVRFIQRAQRLGFTLREIDELLELRISPDLDCGVVRRRAQAKISELEERVRDLQRMRAALEDLATRCLRAADEEACPILDAIEPET